MFNAAAITSSNSLVPRQWVESLPLSPVLSSESLAWREMVVYRVRYPAEFQFTLPAIGGLYLAVHLRTPCVLSTRWNGHFRSRRSVPGESILMCPEQENYWHGIGEMDELQIFLNPSLIREAAAEITDKPIGLSEGLGIRDPMLAAISTRLIEELSRPNHCSRLVGESLAQALVGQLISMHSNLRGPGPSERIDMPAHKLRAAFDYIEAHLGEELSIESVAKAIGMSTFRFARGFKKGTGKSPHTFLVERRIEVAKDLLRSTDRKLAEIARDVGFATQSHFTVVFGQRCGVTPLAYRARTRF